MWKQLDVVLRLWFGGDISKSWRRTVGYKGVLCLSVINEKRGAGGWVHGQQQVKLSSQHSTSGI